MKQRSFHCCAVYTSIIRRYTGHYYRAHKGQLGVFSVCFPHIWRNAQLQRNKLAFLLSPKKRIIHRGHCVFVCLYGCCLCARHGGWGLAPEKVRGNGSTGYNTILMYWPRRELPTVFWLIKTTQELCFIQCSLLSQTDWGAQPSKYTDALRHQCIYYERSIVNNSDYNQEDCAATLVYCVHAACRWTQIHCGC